MIILIGCPRGNKKKFRKRHKRVEITKIKNNCKSIGLMEGKLYYKNKLSEVILNLFIF